MISVTSCTPPSKLNVIVYSFLTTSFSLITIVRVVEDLSLLFATTVSSTVPAFLARSIPSFIVAISLDNIYSSS